MDKKQKLEELRNKMKSDQSLPLRQGATNLAFGDGDPESELLFIGEGPGYWEDMKGIPFVGNAGALLNQLLSLIGIPRNKIYITNVIHYRAPENRDPDPSEINAFKPYLDGIIKIIDPKVIITLGRFSMAKFLPGVMISNVHGKPSMVDVNGKEIIISEIAINSDASSLSEHMVIWGCESILLYISNRRGPSTGSRVLWTLLCFFSFKNICTSG